ncbi:MAG: hypothetical protein IPI46_03750 [Bacteroidetes bacterium]|nr:hypothetical protein [Bacteroidota bacterium]
MKTIIPISQVLFFFFFLSSCDKAPTIPPNPNEEELITTLQITFIDSLGIAPNVVAKYQDLDGDGGNAPLLWDSIKLQTNTTYLANIVLLDETKMPADTISNEVLDEAVDHLFCFEVPDTNCVITRTDKDLNNLEIGLQSTWKTKNQTSGNVRILLRHQPGIKTGDCSLGASDVDLIFGMKIE